MSAKPTINEQLDANNITVDDSVEGIPSENNAGIKAAKAYDNMSKAVEEAAAKAGLAPKKPQDDSGAENISNILDNVADFAADDSTKILEYETQIAELNDQLLRSVAETENVRKRMRKEIDDGNKYAITGFARDVITVVENLYRATDSIKEESIEKSKSLKNLRDGVEMTLHELVNVMNRHGIKRISPEGEMFDHNLHQAMVQIDSDEHAAGTILQVMQAGYTIHDRLLQPAMVGVAKADDKSENADKSE